MKVMLQKPRVLLGKWSHATKGKEVAVAAVADVVAVAVAVVAAVAAMAAVAAVAAVAENPVSRTYVVKSR